MRCWYGEYLLAGREDHMKYKFTQLKDLPDSPAGTVFKCRGIDHHWDCTSDRENHDFYEIVIPDRSGGHIQSFRVGKSIFDDPNWFRKEVDYEKLTELKCQKCGETRADVHVKKWFVGDYDSDNYGPHAEVSLECPCGCTRIIYKR